MEKTSNIAECPNGDYKPSYERIKVCSLELNPRQTIYVTSDSSKTYASMHFGWVGEGVIEVGYSSVNGSAGPGMNPGCVETMSTQLQAFFAERNIKEIVDERQAHRVLFSIVKEADSVFNQWLMEHQGEY